MQKRAVRFWGNVETMYRTNLNVRTALRILKPITRFNARDERHLYNKTYDIDWPEFLSVDDTFAVDSFVVSKHFKHSKYVALKVKDAIADRFRKEFNRRPSVDVERPSLRINIHITHETCTLSLDSSGESLHKRGYRLEKDTAPLNEILAAGLILLSGWDGSVPFVDPMCGSGTIPIEAAQIAGNIAPGIERRWFGFESWPDFQPQIWKKIREEALANIKEPQVPIFAADISSRALQIAENNINRTRLAKCIQLKQAAFDSLEPPTGPGTLVMNPPYGERIQQNNLLDFYSKIGDNLKSKYQGYEAWILSANKAALKCVGLRPSQKITLFNGPLECKYQKFSIYAGSIKSKYKN